MKRWTRGMAIAIALAFAMPAVAGDASDTVTEKKADLRKGARNMKPGGKDASDRVEDAKDTARSSAAKGRKKARSAKRSVKHDVHEATR